MIPQGQPEESQEIMGWKPPLQHRFRVDRVEPSLEKYVQPDMNNSDGGSASNSIMDTAFFHEATAYQLFLLDSRPDIKSSVHVE